MVARFRALAALAALSAMAITFWLGTQHDTAEAADTLTVRTCGGEAIALHPQEKRMLHLQNQARISRDLRRLCVHPALQRAARAHSKDMVRRDYFSHTTRGTQEDACQRIRRYGYRYSSCGENIAWGSATLGSADNIFKGWMHSSSHRQNILSDRYREVGIGLSTGAFMGRRNATVWTVDFGSR